MRLKLSVATMAVGMAMAAVPLAAQVRVVASNGVKAAMEELRPQCERAAAQPLRIEYATSASLAQRIEAGEAFDVAILTSELIDALTKSGKISPAAKADLGRSGIGVGIRKGAKRPDIRTGEALKAAFVGAKSIT